jgi:hypothetical protein
MIACVDTGRVDEICDASRTRIDDESLAFEDEAGVVLRGAAAMAALEKRCDFQYVETLAFLHERHLRQRHLLFYPPAPGRVPARRATPPPLVVRPAPPAGLGVFAGEDVAARASVGGHEAPEPRLEPASTRAPSQADACLAEYAGVAGPPTVAHDGFLLEYAETIGGEALHLSARHYGNVGRFFNHDGAGLQNADLVRCSHDGLLRVFVVATRDIPKGDQILVDYGVAYWRDSPETLRRLSQAGE